MAATDSQQSTLARLADEFIERYRNGQRPRLSDYLVRYPQFGDEIREVFPGLVMMEQFAPLSLTSAGGETEPSVPRQLGDFHIMREVGRGGMGVVYEAEQLSLARRVALKVLPLAAVLDQRQLQRFKNEAMAAAQLDHPHLVEVYGVGCERGVHYYAMRFIEGETLADVIAQLRKDVSQDAPPARHNAPRTDAPQQTETVSVAKLSTLASNREAAFFQSVAEIGRRAAEALDHAHRRGIVHRDVKPSNIMLDEQGKAWVTDFGLAHIEAGAGITQSGDLLGTLRYMSPEQVLAERAVIDHRSDVYSLGVTLYELLTLRPAFPGENRRTLLRQIVGEEPPPPRKINDCVPGELETVVLKAMAKDPRERYATAEEFADDLSRFLKDEPIRARRPTMLQRARRWLWRHRAVLNVAAAVLMLGFLGLSVATALIWNEQQQTKRALSEARQQGELAQQKSRESAAVLRFLVSDMLASTAPERARGRKLTVRDVLRNAEQKIDGAFADQPLVEASIRHTMGTVYYSLADYRAARPHLERALALRRRHLGGEHDDTLFTQNVLGAVHFQTSRWKEAGALFEQCWRIRQRTLGETHPKTLRSMQNWAAALSVQGELDRAFALYERALKLMPRDTRRNERAALIVMSNVADALYRKGNRRHAKAVFEKTLASQRKVLGRNHPRTLMTGTRFARLLRDLNRTAEALELCRDSLQRQRRVLGESHPDTMLSEQTLASIVARRGDYAKAIDMLKRLLAKQRKVLGAEHDGTLSTMTMLAANYRLSGQYEPARPLVEEALATRRRVMGPRHPSTLATLSTLGAVLKGLGDLDGALKCHEEAYRGALKLRGADHPETLAMMVNYGNLLSRSGKTEKARETIEQAFKRMQRVLGEDHPRTLLTAHNLAYVYEDLGQLEQSRDLRAETVKKLRKVLGKKHPHTRRAERALNRVLVRLAAESRKQQP